MTQASSGSDRKIISRAIGQISFGYSEFCLICHKQCTKNDHYFKSCYYHTTKKVLKSFFWSMLVNYFQGKMSDSRLECQ